MAVCWTELDQTAGNGTLKLHLALRAPLLRSCSIEIAYARADETIIKPMLDRGL